MAISFAQRGGIEGSSHGQPEGHEIERLKQVIATAGLYREPPSAFAAQQAPLALLCSEKSLGNPKEPVMEMGTSTARCPHSDFMRNLSLGLVLTILVLSCVACGGSPTVLTAFRTEEQAQTHCPKDIVVWLDPQSGLYYFKGNGSYGRSNAGRYACRGEADAAGMHGMPNQP
jgi:hypothetical protein